MLADSELLHRESPLDGRLTVRHAGLQPIRRLTAGLQDHFVVEGHSLSGKPHPSPAEQ